MRTKPTALLAGLTVLVAAVQVSGSGPLGIYGIVEKVVFEPTEASPERIQVWGAFSFVEGPMPEGVQVISRSQRGYLYFTVPAGVTTDHRTAITREWLDLKSVAGTGQAVGFGRWAGGVLPEPPGPYFPRALHGTEASFRVRAAEQKPASPAPYWTNLGVVKISEQGTNGWVVKQLRDALKRSRSAASFRPAR